MNVANKLKKIRSFLTHNRLIPILKEMSRTAMSLIERNGVPSHKAFHEWIDPLRPRPNQKMKVVWH